VPVQQVMIQARIASVDNDFERELGILYDAVPGQQNGGPVENVNPKHYSLAIAHLPNGSYLNIALAAMERQGRGELISSPSLFTLNHETAAIESGEEIPYQEVSLSGGTAVAFKKAVLRLKVTPQILPQGKLLLELEVNQDRPSDHIVQGVPAITTRQIITHVLVNNGQTLVLGGIFELNKELNEQRVPFLGRIPLLGNLFSDRATKASKRELLIFVTPKVIESR
jgi:type IV pilus assembly protein PilQ